MKYCIVLLTLGALMLSGCGKSAIEDGTVVSVIYSSDTRAKLEGCGCKKNGGGITKRAAKLEAARREDPTVLYVDAGNFLSGTPEVDSTKGDLMIAAYNELGTSVVNVSERELAFGTDAFRKARESSKFTYVSANVRIDGNSIADPYIIKQVKTARVAIVGLCGTRDVMRIDSSKLPSGVTIENPVTVAKRVIPSLAGKSDVVIVLSTCGDQVDSMLAQLSGVNIDLIVGGRSYRPNTSEPWVFGPGFAKGTVGGFRDLGEQVKAAEEKLRSAKAQYGQGLMSRDEVADIQNEVDRLHKQQTEAKGEAAGHNTCIVRTERDGRELGRMDLVFGAKGQIKTFSPKTLSMEVSDPSSPQMLAVIQKYVPSFVDNPTDGARFKTDLTTGPTNANLPQ